MAPTEVPATPAATVVPLRDGPGGIEVLVVQRGQRGVFAGQWVFPGGQVEPGDIVAAQGPDPSGAGGEGDPPEIAAARRAAVREAHEETGLRLPAEDLVVLSFWLPPFDAPRRFATWFFLCPVPSGSEVSVDRLEILGHRWIGPGQALRQRELGALPLLPPTYMTLWWLSTKPGVDQALVAARGRAPERFASRILPTGADSSVIVWPGDAAYEDGDLARDGRRRRLFMRADGWRVEVDE
jgi:8-oxo-dGTP pyrophosphatase MutT (NUDIX family)